MKIKDNLKSITKDRAIVATWFVMLLLAVSLVIVTALQVHYSELQTLVRYTAFGDTKLYSSQWYYLLNFVAFGFVVFILHSLISLKLYDRKGSRLTLVFLGLSISVLIIAYFILLALLNMVSLP
jgi:hypothetical protein